MARKKQKRCRICKKRPVWRGGDVKDPGPFCKKCYHKDVWSQKPPARRKSSEPQQPEPDLEHCPECGALADVCEGGPCPNCGFHFNNALYWWFVR
jgi:hypothetical protein